jgi:hypothetical protein
MAPSKRGTTILDSFPAKQRLNQHDVALHFWFDRKLMTKKAKEINGCTRKGAG